MEKRDLRHMSRRELVDIVYEMTEQEMKLEQIGPEEISAERSRLAYRQKLRKVLSSTVSALVIVAAVAVLFSTLFMPVIQVSGDSMEPSMHDGDILLLLKTQKYDYGTLCCVAWQNKLLMKRVIAMPGDTVEIDEEGNVTVNGEILDEPYVLNKCLGECDITFPYQVPDGAFFVLGDRRDTSIDSRNTVIGSVQADQMVGKVLFRIWSNGKEE
jgi:signal peptidase I